MDWTGDSLKNNAYILDRRDILNVTCMDPEALHLNGPHHNNITTALP